MLAYDYPILGLFWTLMIFFIWVAWIVLVFRIVMDVIRNHDTSGVSKAFWLLFVVLIPWLGVLVYLIAHGNEMAAREAARQRDAQEQFDAYVRQAAGPVGSTADEIAKLAQLRDSGALTEDEFAAQKARLLA